MAWVGVREWSVMGERDLGESGLRDWGEVSRDA